MCGGLILPAMLLLVLYSKSDTLGFSFHIMKKNFGLLVVDKDTGLILHTVKLVFDLCDDADKLNQKRLYNLSDGYLRLMKKHNSLAMTIVIEPVTEELPIPF